MSTTDVQALPAGTWQVDKIHSSIGFSVDYMVGTSTGRSATLTPPPPMAC